MANCLGHCADRASDTARATARSKRYGRKRKGSWQVGWRKKHGSWRERRKKLWRNKSKTPQLHYVFLIPVLNRATCVKSMTSPTIRTRSYEARPLDIVPSRACIMETTSVAHVKRKSMAYLQGRMARAQQARARARTAEKQATENKAIAEHATEYADNLWKRCNGLLVSTPRGSLEAIHTSQVVGPPFFGGLNIVQNASVVVFASDRS